MKHEHVELVGGRGSYRLTFPSGYEMQEEDNMVESGEVQEQVQVTAGRKRKGSDKRCHQCHNAKNEIVFRCVKCEKKYCASCFDKYQNVEAVKSSGACPICLDICNCAHCMKSVPSMDYGIENMKKFANSDVNASMTQFLKGQPFMVDNVLGQARGMSWDSKLLQLIFLRNGDNSMDVMDCSNWSEEKIQARNFFNGYRDGICSRGQSEPKILRSENWPPPGLFKEKLPRHYPEVLRCLPFNHLTNQGPCCLEMAIKQLKMCVGYGPNRKGSHHGGAKTKLRCAISDTVSTLMHIGAARGQAVDPKMGCVWEIFLKKDIPELQEYLKKHFSHVLPMHQTPHKFQETVYLTEDHIRQLKNECGIEPCTFVQKLGDAVFLPAGSHYQSQNLQSCTHVEVDFSLESMPDCSCSIGTSSGTRNLVSPMVYTSDKRHLFIEDVESLCRKKVAQKPLKRLISYHRCDN